MALGEQAVALDPGNETAWRHLVLSYISVGEVASATAAFSKTADHPALSPMISHLFRNEWREAGEKAYAVVAAGPTYFQVEMQVSLAIRRHARVTGDYQRAIKALESWASVVWEGDEPILQGQLDMGAGVAGLADMLMQTNQKQRAQVLLKELLANADLQVNRFGRGEIWLNQGRALAYALLDRPDDAVKTLQRQLQLGFLPNAWRVMLEDEPIFDRLEERKEFQALVAACQAIEEREREQFLRMRAEGRIPDRSEKSIEAPRLRRLATPGMTTFEDISGGSPSGLAISACQRRSDCSGPRNGERYELAEAGLFANEAWFDARGSWLRSQHSYRCCRPLLSSGTSL